MSTTLPICTTSCAIRKRFKFNNSRGEVAPSNRKEKKYIQRVLDSFLYYLCALDLLNHFTRIVSKASERAKPSKQTLARVQQLLDYMATNPNAVVRFYASDMILNLLTLRCLIFISRTGQKQSWWIFFLRQCTKG